MAKTLFANNIYLEMAHQEWESLTPEEKSILVDKWISAGGLLNYVYEVLHYTDDAGVEFEENMDYDEIEDVFLYHYWYLRRAKELEKYVTS